MTASHTTATATGGNRRTKPRYVLVAEAQPDTLALYRKLLSSRGFVVHECPSAAAVMEALAARQPDLMLLELDLPDQPGQELLIELRKDPRHFRIPIIVASAYDQEQTIAEVMSHGADDYLVKPVKPGELLAKIGVILQRRNLAQLTAQGYTSGTLFGGRYEIVSTLGTGGYGTIYLALDTQEASHPQVALKAFHGEKAQRPNFISRFLREAYAHSRLNHPNLVRLRDFGQHDRIFYLVMEYLDGMTLHQIMDTSGVLSEETAVTVAYEMAKALDYLHRSGVVHRDVKPANIMVTHGGETKLLDFGMCRSAHEETLSAAEFVGGTPEYVSPEYIVSSQHLDIRADIYSLGVTLYHAVTNSFPFPTASDLALIDHHLHTPPVPLAERRGDLSPGFCRLVDRMLAKAPADRPDTVALLKALVELMV